MIENSQELAVAARNLAILEEALESLRQQLQAENPDLLALTESAYLQRINALQTEIADYLSAYPSAVSLLVRGQQPLDDLPMAA